MADDLPPALANTYLFRMQNESRRALTEMQLPGFCLSAAWLGVPAIVVGREGDRLIPLAALKRTGYSGWLAMEPFDYVPDGPGSAAHSIGYVRGVLEGLQ